MDQLPVAAYFRVSQARDGMSAPEMYRDDIERYCSYRKLDLGETFSDIDYSAYRGSKARPALEELKRRRFEFSSVIIPKLSRFGRSVKDLVELFDMFDRDGIALIFLDMNIDTATSQGRLLRHVMAAFAEYESDVKSDYSKATQRLLVREGRPMGPRPLFGYALVGRHSERRYVVDKDAAALVRSVFKRYVGGKGMAALAVELNRSGARGPDGVAWSYSQVRGIITNTGYAAFRVYEGEEHACSWRPLVSRALWERAQSVRRERTIPRSAPEAVYLLSGVLVCGVCGHTLRRSASGKRLTYRCPSGDGFPPYCRGGRILAHRAEDLITGALIEAAEARRAGGGAELEQRWSASDVEARRALMSDAITRVVLVARPPGNQSGKGTGPKRSIRIEWTRDHSLELFGYIGATSTLTPDDTSIGSPRGKSWREWRKARLLPH